MVRSPPPPQHPTIYIYIYIGSCLIVWLSAARRHTTRLLTIWSLNISSSESSPDKQTDTMPQHGNGWLDSATARFTNRCALCEKRKKGFTLIQIQHTVNGGDIVMWTQVATWPSDAFLRFLRKQPKTVHQIPISGGNKLRRRLAYRPNKTMHKIKHIRILYDWLLRLNGWFVIHLRTRLTGREETTCHTNNAYNPSSSPSRCGARRVLIKMMWHCGTPELHARRQVVKCIHNKQRWRYMSQSDRILQSFWYRCKSARATWRRLFVSVCVCYIYVGGGMLGTQ